MPDGEESEQSRQIHIIAVEGSDGSHLIDQAAEDGFAALSEVADLLLLLQIL